MAPARGRRPAIPFSVFVLGPFLENARVVVDGREEDLAVG
jgi:hypothetical protein